ncbi:MAG TPA: TIR domain-containing protein, partial [Kineosporiaceae bacterium]|nr:TIR domain-containing protein [Kineosporiaceae bacterium]
QHGRGQPPHDVFVSYSTGDKPIADAIVSRLEQAGIRCWVAPRDVIPGQVFAEAIVQAIHASRMMVVIVSGHANQSHHVLREVERAVANNVVIVPFCIETIEPSGALAYYLANEHWLDAMSPPVEAHVAELVQVAHVLLARDSPTPAAPPVSPAPRRVRRRRLEAVAVGVASLAVLGVLGAILFLSSNPKQPTSIAQPGRPVNIHKLVGGDCLLTPQDYAHSGSTTSNYWADSQAALPQVLSVVPCGQPHSAEVVVSSNVNGSATASYPGDTAINNEWSSQCESAFETYVGIPYRDSTLAYTGISPDASSWSSGDRQLLCIAYNPTGDTLLGSIRGSAQ